MASEAERALIETNPVIGTIIRERGPFNAVATRVQGRPNSSPGPIERGLRFLRRNVFDRFGRR
jgi:hypothetical protein